MCGINSKCALQNSRHLSVEFIGFIFLKKKKSASLSLLSSPLFVWVPFISCRFQEWLTQGMKCNWIPALAIMSTTFPDCTDVWTGGGSADWGSP